MIVAASAENTNQDGFILDIGSLRINAGAHYFTDEQLARRAVGGWVVVWFSSALGCGSEAWLLNRRFFPRPVCLVC